MSWTSRGAQATLTADMKILISGASFAGLASAYWMTQLGHHVTLVEVAAGLKKGGTPVNIEGDTRDVVQRMGLLEAIEAHRIAPSRMAFMNADNTAAQSMPAPAEGGDLEIERDVLLQLLFDLVKEKAEVRFGDSITALADTGPHVDVTFKRGDRASFDLVLGCDGIHSVVRKLAFGDESQFVRFLGAYFSITIVPTLLLPEDTTQMYNEPGKAMMLKTYNGKTDVVLCFASERELPYDYRDEAQQRAMITQQFASVGWRAPELLDQVQRSKTFYFDKLCQMRMPAWSTGRVGLVGDAAYCASPAAGKGGSLAIDGAAALGDAFRTHDDHARAFAAYDASFRPYIEEVQRQVAEFGVAYLIPMTAAAIEERNAHPPFAGEP